MDSISTSNALLSDYTGNIGGNRHHVPEAYYIFEAGNYMTYSQTYKHDEYYPNACLFCGLPNGIKKSPTSVVVSSTATDIVSTAAPRMQSYPLMASERQQNRLIDMIVHKHYPVSRNLASSISRGITHRCNTWFQTWRHYVIRKRLHFPVSSFGRKRLLVPSSFY